MDDSGPSQAVDLVGSMKPSELQSKAGKSKPNSAQPESGAKKPGQPKLLARIMRPGPEKSGTDRGGLDWAMPKSREAGPVQAKDLEDVAGPDLAHARTSSGNPRAPQSDTKS